MNGSFEPPFDLTHFNAPTKPNTFQFRILYDKVGKLCSCFIIILEVSLDRILSKMT
jgi:hypothetical protein